MTSWTFAAWLLLGGSTVLLFLGLPVAFSFLVVNIVGAWLWLGGEPGFVQLARNAVSSVTSFSLTPIPLFVLMGEILFHTGLAVKVMPSSSTRATSPVRPSEPSSACRRTAKPPS